MRRECLEICKKLEKKKFKKPKTMIVTWSDEDEDQTSENLEKQKDNLCLMTHEEKIIEINDECETFSFKHHELASPPQISFALLNLAMAPQQLLVTRTTSKVKERVPIMIPLKIVSHLVVYEVCKHRRKYLAKTVFLSKSSHTSMLHVFSQK
ncbi:hypothetical protein Taro_018553 [Colocasia esculenta]|uniref:Uncharacterized protein n=1 Tax=Colocasia esculenta TaxID=4460 RepID=A0A843URP6_COLES|nr:hypothetical protein [Colocasia esculenta]